jgi:hypothetical protein
MVLARLRRSSRVVAALVLASFWALSHPASDDPCVVGPLEAHDESKHVMGAAADAEPNHCVVCHSLRTAKRPFGPAPYLQVPPVAAVIVDAAAARRLGSPEPGRIPARAPPAR